MLYNSDVMSILNKKVIATAFSSAAQTYEPSAFLQREVANRLCDRVRMQALTVEAILDLGSGTGYLTQQLAAQFPQAQLIALDLAWGMLQYAKQRQADVDYLCADAEALPLASASLDLICSSLVLHWCPDIDKAFSEMQRVLRPGGELLLTTLGPTTLYELQQSWAAVDDRPHVHSFLDLQALGNGLLQSGWCDIVVDREELYCFYPDVISLMRDLKNIGAHNMHPERRKTLTGKQALQTMMRAYQRFVNEEGLFPATYEVLHVRAKKSVSRQVVENNTVKVPVEQLMVSLTQKVK